MPISNKKLEMEIRKAARKAYDHDDPVYDCFRLGYLTAIEKMAAKKKRKSRAKKRKSKK